MEMSLKDLRELIGAEPESTALDQFIGQPIIVRTVTMIQTGRLKSHDRHFLVLTDAAWIADTGRWADALAGRAPFGEIEPFPNGDVLVGIGAVIDLAALSIDPPRDQK